MCAASRTRLLVYVLLQISVAALIELGTADRVDAQAGSPTHPVRLPAISPESIKNEDWTVQEDGNLAERIQQLEQNQAQLIELLHGRDEWIASALSENGSVLSERRVTAPRHDPNGTGRTSHFGTFSPGGGGFKLASTRYGDVNFSAWTYIRYLNRDGLNKEYTDAFGRTFAVDQRNDVQLNKVNLYFKGWIYDPKLRYLLYVWTANTSQGDPAQVVVGGNLNYVCSESLIVGAGIDALPGVRSTRGTFPFWLKVDYRTIADEFFRPSFTQGIWARGEIARGLNYRVMLGNNLSQLGVNAVKLDQIFDTVSGTIWWMPTTGEFGPLGGFGDFEEHQNLATLIGLSMTHSTEDKQSQPGVEDLNNTQLRLSDGTIIFTPNAFDTGGQIDKATYYMMSVDAGLKYGGLAIEGEYYFRWLENFRTVGAVPVNSLFDHGFQTQLSAMVVSKTIQSYVSGSSIFGQYGTPWELGTGVNWFPKHERLFRVNAELLYLDKSPVGYASVPFTVGAKGLVFNTNVELVF